MLKRLFFVFLALACLLMPACSGRSMPESGSKSEAGDDSGEAQWVENSILTKVLAAASDDVTSFNYDGNAPYYFGGEHGLWSKNGYSATVFSCRTITEKQETIWIKKMHLSDNLPGRWAAFPSIKISSRTWVKVPRFQTAIILLSALC